MVNCKICEKEFGEDRQLHAHLKAHKLRMAGYYQKHFPRKDLYTKEIIKFKNKNYYFSNDFNSRINMKKWLKDQPIEKAKEYTKKILTNRAERKNLEYTPSQVELRTIMSPPIQYFNELFGDYYSVCEEMGLKNRFISYPKENSFSIVDYSNQKNLEILVDTREQFPLKLDFPFQIKTLKFGDYTLSDREVCCDCYIERKSIKDFVGTLSGGLERFKREIERALENEAYLVVLVETQISKCMAFDKLPYVSKKIKATPEYIFRNVRDICQQYDHLQFLFVDGRKEAVRVMKKILFCGCLYKDYDLQLSYDLKIL
jgi:hypothetical protein